MRNFATAILLAASFLMVSISDAYAYTVWNTETSSPAPGELLGFARGSDDRLYAWAADQGDRRMFAYHTVTKTWVSRAPLPRFLWTVGGTQVNGMIYSVAGISNSTFQATHLVYSYNPATNVWTRRADLPGSRWAVRATAVDGDVYAWGVNNPGNPRPQVYRYHPASDHWSVATNVPGNPSSVGYSIAAIGGVIYFVGGLNASDDPSGIVATYTPATNTWTNLSSEMPHPRTAPAAVRGAEGKLYVIGGVNANGDIVGTVDFYDPATKTWGSGPRMPTTRYNLNAALGRNGAIYALGGTLDVPVCPPCFTGALEALR